MKTKQEMGKASRRKGHQFEREVARILRSVFPNAKRGWQARSGVESPDIIGTPFWIECKRYKHFTNGQLVKWFQHAVSDATEAQSKLPVVLIAKQDRRGIIVMVDQVLAGKLDIEHEEQDPKKNLYYLVETTMDVFIGCLKRRFNV